MSKKSIKLLSIVFTIAIVLMTLTVPAFATETPTEITPGSFEPDVNSATSGVSELQSAGNKIIGIIQVVGMLTAVIILMVLGIKYMMGSAEEKASYKKTMMPYLVGAVLLFAASGLAEIVYNFVSDIA